METIASSGSLPIPQEPADYDDVSMQQSLLFSDSLKDLKSLRTQLYSAAEYFELSYTYDDQKQIVLDTLKDYAIKALVNTVDHLGSVTSEVNDQLDEKVDEVSGTELRVSCIKQRLRTCQEYIDQGGLSQQSLMINTPKYNKRYILPGLDRETMHGASHTKVKHQGCSLDDKEDGHQFRNAGCFSIAVQTTKREIPSASVRKGRSPSPSPRPLQQPATFSFTATKPKKEQEKRAVSPTRFPLLDLGSLSSRPTTPNSKMTVQNSSRRATTPNRRLPFPNSSWPTAQNPASARPRHLSEPRNSVPLHLHSEKEIPKETEQYPRKSNRLLKSLLSRRKSKEDEMLLYTYLDEY
ncbi:protein ABIL2-like isoform X2 [Cornus florida]|uniref:protein ABIL2-like isoform X2 n=1 Tax=Cornus florida TaxID=4283 RepID=UPI0028996016|nr:protein ABIL2-like isoform X2 [Cornus florida]